VFTTTRHLSLSWARSTLSTLPSHFLKIYFNIIFPSTPRSSKRFLSLRFTHQTPVCTSPHPIRATCPARLILLDSISRTLSGEEYRPYSSSLHSLLHSPVIPFPLRPKNSPQYPILEHAQLMFPINVRDQVPHPYKTTGKSLPQIWLLPEKPTKCIPYELAGATTLLCCTESQNI